MNDNTHLPEPGHGWMIVHEGKEISPDCRVVLEHRKGAGQNRWLSAGARTEGGGEPAASAPQQAESDIVSSLEQAVRPLLPDDSWSAKHAVCVHRLPFYHPPRGDAWLFELFDCGKHARSRFVAVLEEADREPDEQGGGAPLKVAQWRVLDWSSVPLHWLNSELHLDLSGGTGPEAEHHLRCYLDFFCGSLAGEEGTFIFMDESVDGIEPPGTDTGDRWEARVRMVYGAHVFNAVMAVAADGMVEMLEDSPATETPPAFATALHGFDRTITELGWDQSGETDTRTALGPVNWWTVHVGPGFPRDALCHLVDDQGDEDAAGPLTVNNLSVLAGDRDDLWELLTSQCTLVRCRRLKWYGDHDQAALLCEFFRKNQGGEKKGENKEEKPGSALAGYERARCIVLMKTGGEAVELVPLDWKSGRMYRLADELGFPAPGPGRWSCIADYLQYFCSSLRGDTGSGIPTFTIVDPISKEQVEWVGNKGSGEKGLWRVRGVLGSFSDRTFEAEFTIDTRGRVIMVDDNRIKREPPAEAAVLSGCKLFTLEDGALPPYRLDGKQLLDLLGVFGAGIGSDVRDGRELLEYWVEKSDEYGPESLERWDFQTTFPRALEVAEGVEIRDGGTALALSALLAGIWDEKWFVGLRLRSYLTLQGIDCRGTLTLAKLRVGGGINLRRARVSGDLRLHSVVARDRIYTEHLSDSGRVTEGAIDMKGAVIEGEIYATDIEARKKAGKSDDVGLYVVLYAADAQHGAVLQDLRAKAVDFRYLRTRSGGLRFLGLRLDGDLEGRMATVKGNLSVSGYKVGWDRRIDEDMHLIEGDLRLNGAKVAGSVFLGPGNEKDHEFRVGGKLILSDIQVGGHIECEELRVEGGVEMISPCPLRALYLRSGKRNDGEGTGSDRRGPVRFVGLTTDVLEFTNTQMTQMELRGCRVKGELELNGVTVAGSEKGDGTINLHGSPVGRMTAAGLTCRRLDLSNVRVDRGVNIEKSRIGSGAETDSGAGLFADFMGCGGDWLLDQSCLGALSLRHATVAGSLDCGVGEGREEIGAREAGERDRAVPGGVIVERNAVFDHIEVGGGVHLGALQVNRGFSMSGHVGGKLAFGCGGGQVRIHDELDLEGVKVEDSVEFFHCRVGGGDAPRSGEAGEAVAADLNKRGVDLSRAEIDHLVVSRSCFTWERKGPCVTGGKGKDRGGDVILNDTKVGGLKVCAKKGGLECRTLELEMAEIKGDACLLGLTLLKGCGPGIKGRRMKVAGKLELCKDKRGDDSGRAVNGDDGVLEKVEAPRLRWTVLAGLGLLLPVLPVSIGGQWIFMGVSQPAGLDVPWNWMALAVLLLFTLYVAWCFYRSAEQMHDRFHCGYDDMDRELPLDLSLLGKRNTNSGDGSGSALPFRLVCRWALVLLAIAIGGLVFLGWWIWAWLSGMAVSLHGFWLLGLFMVAGYLVHRLFEICNINAISVLQEQRKRRDEQRNRRDEYRELRRRLRARQLGFRDLLYCAWLVRKLEKEPEEKRPEGKDAPMVTVAQARIGHWQMNEPLPERVELSNVAVDRWSVDGKEPCDGFLRILELATEFKRSTYSHIEQALRNQGDRELADRIHRAMRRQEQWREKRRLVTAFMLLHSLIGYGTRRAPVLMFMLVWYLFTAAWIAAEHPQVVTLATDTRIGLHEITGQDPQAPEAVALAQYLDPSCDGRADGEDCRWGGAGGQAGGGPAGGSPREWLVRVGHGLALAMRYHVPIIAWDPWPYIQPRGAAMWAYTSMVEVAHWVLWPLLLASLLQALLPRRED